MEHGTVDLSVVTESDLNPSETIAGLASVADLTDGTITAQVDESGQQIIIVTPDSQQDIICKAEEEDEESGEPTTKKIRIQHENGQTYILAVSDSVLAEHLQASSSQEASTSSQQKDGDDVDTDVSQAWFTTKDDKSALQNRGHSWKQGQWSREEVAILTSNISEYCRKNDIGDPTEVIFEMSKDERKDFYRCIARGLDRPLFSVYRRVIRMYDQRNHIGKYSPEEIERLKELRVKHGTDWATIGAALGRSASSVKDRCRLMKETCNSGKWLPEEEKRLSSAVYEQTGCKPGESIVSGLSWAAVAEKVITRSEKQCRTKWLNYLNWKQKGGNEWTREDDIALVLKIAETGATEESKVDWSQLAKDWSSVRSPQWLRGKWWSLKRHVPEYQLLPFTDLIECLKNMHSLNVKLKPASLLARKQQQQLSQIEAVSSTAVLPDHSTQTLQIPVLVSAEDGSVVTTGDVDQHVQSLEILPSAGLSTSAALSQGAFLITQPHISTNAISLAANGQLAASDHIILHTVPIAQDGSDGVTLNQHQQVIIAGVAGQETLVNVADIVQQQQSHPELQLLAQAVSNPGNSEVGCVVDHTEHVEALHSVVDTQTAQTLAANQPFETQVLNVADVNNADLEGVVATTDLVLTASASPQIVQPSVASTLLHMSSLSDPMLTSSDTDLMGSCSDIEAEKVNLVTEDPDVEREVDSPAT